MTGENAVHTEDFDKSSPDTAAALNAPDRENLDEGVCVAAETAEADKEESKAAPATGKFKSVEALMSAYLNLEAEFTRRSQKLKELEESKACEAPSVKRITGEELLNAALADENVRNAVVGDYLKTVIAGKSVPLIVGGVACAAPACEPKSVKEAGALVKQFLKK